MTLGVCLSLSLVACGGGSAPAPIIQQPTTPVQSEIKVKAPDSLIVEAGSESNFEIYVNEPTGGPAASYDISVVFPEASGVNIIKTSPADSNGRRVLTIRVDEKALEGNVQGTLSVKLGTSSKTVPITVLIKAKTAGSYFSSFGQGGLAALELPSGAVINYAADVSIDQQGRLLVLGYTQLSRGTDTAFTVTRFLSTGALDTTYGTNGSVLVNPTDNEEWAQRIFVAPDGRVLVFGFYSAKFGVMRLAENGAVDSSFGTNGILTLNTGYFPQFAAAQDDQGRVVLALVSNVSESGYLTRFNSDGTLDNSFSSSGFAHNSTYSQAIGIQILSTGEAILATVKIGDNQDILLRKFKANGSLDQNFGSQGQISIDLGSSQDTLSGIVINPQDKIFVLGRTKNLNPVLVKLAADGVRSASFGTNGQIVFPDDADVVFDSLLWNGTDVVIYDSYTTIQVAAAKVSDSGNISRLTFTRPLATNDGRTTLTKILWNQQLKRYIGYGDLENYNSNPSSSRGAIYTFSP